MPAVLGQHLLQQGRVGQGLDQGNCLSAGGGIGAEAHSGADQDAGTTALYFWLCKHISTCQVQQQGGGPRMVGGL